MKPTMYEHEYGDVFKLIKVNYKKNLELTIYNVFLLRGKKYYRCIFNEYINHNNLESYIKLIDTDKCMIQDINKTVITKNELLKINEILFTFKNVSELKDQYAEYFI